MELTKLILAGHRYDSRCLLRPPRFIYVCDLKERIPATVNSLNKEWNLTPFIVFKYTK